MADIGEKFWVFVLENGDSWQTWGYLTEAIANYNSEHGTMDAVVAIVSH